MQSEISVKYGMNVFDISLRTYGVDNIIKLLQENAISADYNFLANPAKKIKYDPTFVIPLPPDIIAKPIVIKTTGSTKGVNGQTIFDIMLMSVGGVDNLIKLIQANKIDNLNTSDIDQKVFIFDSELIKDNIYYNSLGTYIVATGGDINRPGGPATHFRITSAGEYRVTSAGDKRYWE